MEENLQGSNHPLRGPYRVRSRDPRYSHEERSAQLGQPPLCACGCGKDVEWDHGRCRWRRYATRKCYHPPRPYHDRDWLLREYVAKRRTALEIATECGVAENSILSRMRTVGIARRSASDAHKGRQAGSKNPAWKGGVANWAYSSDWKAVARAIRQRDDYRCQMCLERRKHWGNALHVHHIDGNKLNNSPDNLISVCATCHHGKLHGNGA